jgi:hypothetical protein
LDPAGQRIASWFSGALLFAWVTAVRFEAGLERVAVRFRRSIAEAVRNTLLEFILQTNRKLLFERIVLRSPPVPTRFLPVEADVPFVTGAVKNMGIYPPAT